MSDPFNQNHLRNIASEILAAAKKKGAGSTEVDISANLGFAVNVRQGEVDTLEYNQGKGISIVVYLGHKKGTVRSNDLSPEALNLALEKAFYIADLSTEDPCTKLADPTLLAYNYPDLDLYHPWNIEPRAAIQLAQGCEKEAFALDTRITNSEGVSIMTNQGFSIYANSHGFVGAYPVSSQSLSCALIAGQGDDMQRDYSYTMACAAEDLIPATEVIKDAVERTVRRLGARPFKTQRCPVIFAADVAKSLIGDFVGAISGYNLYRKASFLLDKIGARIFAKHVQIDLRPHLPRVLGSSPFDDEGVKTTARYLVQDGILCGYLLDTYSACKLGMQTTGNAGGIHNLFLGCGDKNLKQLFKEMGRGLFITEVFGQSANLVTGDYSRAAFGFWIENGEIQYPVSGITVAGNLKDMFLQLVAVGNDVDHRSSIHTGSIWIDNLTVAGDAD